MREIAFVNGQFVPLAEARVPVEDRGHQFGDGVYEVVYAFNGVPFALEEHLDRFFNSMAMIRLNSPYTRAEVTALIREALQRSGYEKAVIYWHLTRGTSPRSHAFPTPSVAGNLVITVREGTTLPDATAEKGVTAHLTEDLRWARCNIKSLNLLPNVLAKQEALERGALEAILCKEGRITEGAVSNVFIVSDGQVRTAPADHRILPGITRMHVLALCRELDLSVTEQAFTPDELYGADEVFLTGSGIEVLPVVRVDDRLINGGQVGPVSLKLRAAYRQLVNKRCGII